VISLCAEETYINKLQEKHRGITPVKTGGDIWQYIVIKAIIDIKSGEALTFTSISCR